MTNDTIIRTYFQLRRTDMNILKGIRILVNKPNAVVPVVYQYSHDLSKPLEITDDITIGHLSNIRFDVEGNLVGHLELNQVMPLSKHYQGRFDNIVASVPTKNSDIVSIDGFIVYDSEFVKMKEEEKEIKKRKDEKAKFSMSQGMAREGEIPIMNDKDNLDMDEITKKLADEFKRQFHLDNKEE